MITIDKNIPVPALRNSYPFNEMEIGDSFLIKCETLKKLRSRQVSIISSLSKRRDERKYTTRTYKETLELRVWRLK